MLSIFKYLTKCINHLHELKRHLLANHSATYIFFKSPLQYFCLLQIYFLAGSKICWLYTLKISYLVFTFSAKKHRNTLIILLHALLPVYSRSSSISSVIDKNEVFNGANSIRLHHVFKKCNKFMFAPIWLKIQKN